MKYDLIVIGGGPAGYVGAIRAAQLGVKVACIERDRAGGTCLNWGCIPTKSLLRNAEVYQMLQTKADDFGLSFDNLCYDWDKVIKRSRGVSDRLAGGVEHLFKKYGVEYIQGEASIEAGKKVKIQGREGKSETHEAKNILVTTGCQSRELPILPFNHKNVIGSKEAMVLPKQPKIMIILGAGAIGCEFAYFYNAFGTEVTLVEMLPRILPVEDEESSKVVERSFKKQGIKVKTATKVVGASNTSRSVTFEVENKQGKKEELKAETALIAIGVAPVLPGGLDLELTDRGYIKTDDTYQTSVEGIYAAGDIIGPPWLAHVASWEALQVVEHLFENHKPTKVDLFPGCTYCQPQVASVGMTEQACKDAGLKYKVGKFPFQAAGKALAMGDTEGHVKVLISEEYGEILGCHIVGHEATELIAEMTLAMGMEATWEEIEATIHAHPTLSEAVHEATANAMGRSVNF
jgi:dihydrolipoamide dehydrogenase